MNKVNKIKKNKRILKKLEIKEICILMNLIHCLLYNNKIKLTKINYLISKII